MTRLRGSWLAGTACLIALLASACSGLRRAESGGGRSDPPAGVGGDNPTVAASAEGPGASGVISDDPGAPTEPVEVLYINEDAITVEEVVGPVRAELATQAATMSPARYRETLVRMVRDRIRAMARDVLLYQEASRRLSEQESDFLERFTDQRIRDIVQQDYHGRQVRWEQAMTNKGLTPEQARERIRRELVVIRHLQQTIAPRVQEPTRRELMRYFEQHQGELTAPERREMYLIEVPKGDDPEQARTSIEQALAELEGGEDFEAVAGGYSEGIHAGDGGHWGVIDPASVRGRWAEAAKVLATLSAGDTSGIVEGDESFFIVRLGHVEPAREPDFAEVQVQLKKAYHDQQFNALVEELVTQLQAQATIRPANLNLFLEAAVSAVHGP